jgi:hypothetical protein
VSDEPRPPEGEEPSPPEGEGAAPPAPRCEVCGNPLEADQTYCLECGAPTPLAPRLRRGGKALLILAGAVAILGIGAGALAYAVVNDDGGGAAASTGAAITAPPPTSLTTPAVTTPGTGPLPPDTSFTSPTAPTAPATTAFPTVTGPSSTPTDTSGTTTAGSTTTTEATTEAPPQTDTEPDSGSSDWPSGTSAWTAILASVRNEGDAQAAKTKLTGSGEDAGVLDSDDFPELRPGYWVVFSGMYDGKQQAIAQADRLRPQFPDAYARHLEG